MSIYPEVLPPEFGPRVQPPPPEPVERGFPGLRCILCGEKDCVKLRLLDCTFLCDQCEEEFDAEDVRAHLHGWVAEAWPPGSALGSGAWVWAAWRQTEAEAWDQAREFAREKGLVPEGV
jgi:hypothetical protein